MFEISNTGKRRMKKIEEATKVKSQSVFGGGKQIVVGFPNGFGVSIICSSYSYGGSDGLLEVAVLYNNELCYDTNITNDVIGYLTADEAIKLIKQVEALPKKFQKKQGK